MLEGTPAPVSGTTSPAGPRPTPPPVRQEGTIDRFVYYSITIQAVISIFVLLGAFWVIIGKTTAGESMTAYNLVVFVTGVWLGRGVDYGLGWIKRNA